MRAFLGALVFYGLFSICAHGLFAAERVADPWSCGLMWAAAPGIIMWLGLLAPKGKMSLAADALDIVALECKVTYSPNDMDCALQCVEYIRKLRAASVPSSPTDERAEFEKSQNFVGYTFDRDYNGDYTDRDTYHAWLGWLARPICDLEGRDGEEAC